MQSDRPTPPKSSLCSSGGASSAQIIDLSAEGERRYQAAKAERRRKHGRRHQYVHMEYQKWKRRFDAVHMLSFICRLSNERPSAEPDNFRTGGVSLTPREHRVMATLISWYMRPQAGRGRLGLAEIHRRTGLNKGILAGVLHRMGDAKLIVNLGGNSAPNLAPNPDFEFWELRRLKELRKLHDRGARRYEAR